MKIDSVTSTTLSHAAMVLQYQQKAQEIHMSEEHLKQEKARLEKMRWDKLKDMDPIRGQNVDITV